MDNPKRVLSLDIPWGKSNVVGVAYYDSDLRHTIEVSAVSGRNVTIHDGFDDLVECKTELSSFIEFGASAQCIKQQDSIGPFGKYPSNSGARKAYLRFLYCSFMHLRSELELDNTIIDIVLVDLPIVTSQTIWSLEFETSCTFRPVELAFASKVMIAGDSSKRPDGRIQFARFQPGVHNGCRAGHAVFELAAHVFSGNKAIESFPQLSLGALSENAANNDGPMISKLAAHKKGKLESIANGQEKLNQQLSVYLDDITLEWINVNLTVRERGDAYDGVLGILPGLELTRPAEQRKCKPVILRNVANNELAYPVSTGAGNSMLGSRDWIIEYSATETRIDESGILTLDLQLWG